MPRPIWKGQISFGLVNIPVVLYSAEEPSDGVKFHFIDKKNHARVRNQRVNEKTGKPVEWGDIERGYELEDGTYIIFSDEELDKLEVEANQSVEISAFVDFASIKPSYFSKPYYLIPEKRGRKGYVILREALKAEKKVGVAKVVVRTREYLAALSPEGEGLMLYLLRYEYELREPSPKDLPGLDLKEAGVTTKELEIAGQLIETMSADWNPKAYKDEYREALMNWIDERAKKGGTHAPTADGEAAAPSGEVIDIMSLLKASMEKAKSSDIAHSETRKAKTS